MNSAATFKRPLIALAVASVLAAGCSEVTLPGVRNANAVAVQPFAAQAAASALPDFASLVEQHGPAVVKIEVSKVQRASLPEQAPPQLDEFFRHFGVPRPEGRLMPNPAPAQGVGSGFVVSPDGTILTNAHVVDGAGEVTVKLSDKREFTAKVVGVDRMTDVAVVKVEASGLPTVKIGDPAKTRVGEWVAAIGSPFGMDHSVTSGIVSAKSRNLPNERLVPFLQTDVAVNPGNSGGPLFNMAGEVIGINSQIYSTTGGYMGMSFAIPIDVAMKVKEQLVAHGKVTRGRIGVTVQQVTPALAQSFGLDKPRGALVSGIEPGGPAADGGLQAGDVVVAFNGKPIASSGELPALVAETKPGETVKVGVVRKGAERQMQLTVGEMPSERTSVAGAPALQQGKLGVSVRPGDKGLEIEQAEGPAAKAGLRAGDIIVGVNGTPVRSIDELRNAVEGAGGNLAILVQRGNARLYVPVQIG
ncbi:MAG TPA: DegQ family serine endoprotease [Burkholderiales bacterium]